MSWSAPCTTASSAASRWTARSSSTTTRWRASARTTGQAWFGCACCPPNLARLLASLGQYVYSQGDEDVAVHLYVQGHADLTVGGQPVTLSQTTDYPWDGSVTLTVAPEQPAQFRLRLRLPEWCRDPRLSVNAEAVSPPTEAGYAVLEREWQAGDTVTLEMPMPVERVYATPKVRQDRGHVALQRGPVVYCLEAADNGGDLEALVLPREGTWEPAFEPDLLSGVTILRGTAARVSEDGWDGTLYRTEPPAASPVAVTAVPYFAWDNRAPGEMRVWVRE